MRPTSTRRIGRPRTLVVLAAMAVSMVAGTTTAAIADDGSSAQVSSVSEVTRSVEARNSAAKAPWNRVTADVTAENGGGFTTLGFSWF